MHSSARKLAGRKQHRKVIGGKVDSVFHLKISDDTQLEPAIRGCTAPSVT